MASPTGSAKNYIWQGRKVSLLEMERIVGISDDVLRKRIKAGATLEQAVAMGGPKKPRMLHNFNGTALSVAEISRITGLRRETISERIRRGLSIEDATAIPKGARDGSLYTKECANPNCKKEFLGSTAKRYCSKRCVGEVFSMKHSSEKYYDFDGKRMTKQQISRQTGVSVFDINCRVKHFGVTVDAAARIDFKFACRYCSELFTPMATCRAGFCSSACSNRYCNEASDFAYKERYCVGCGQIYQPKSRAQDYCSKSCKANTASMKIRHEIASGSASEHTIAAYALRHNNWKRYFNSLCTPKRRKDGLNCDTLVAIRERQQGRCALSGIEMTCIKIPGVKSPLNASIDRIIPGGPYTVDNIQLVCKVLNCWRSDTSVEEFKYFCKRVADYSFYSIDEVQI